MHRRLKLVAKGVVVATVTCALTVLAAEPRRVIDASKALDASIPQIEPIDIAVTPTPPDPTPLVERHQWVYDLRWDRGEVWLVGARPFDLPVPQATPRVMGRFALELFEGPTLIERVRFDFPLLGDAVAAAPDASTGMPSLSQKLRTRIGVVFPAVRRGTRLELVDRATGRRWSVPWPVDEPLAAPPKSASRDAGAAR